MANKMWLSGNKFTSQHLNTKYIEFIIKSGNAFLQTKIRSYKNRCTNFFKGEML